MNELKNKKAIGTEKAEFRVFNQRVETLSVCYGAFLMFWGIIVSFVSSSQSFTSLIPALFGFLLCIFSLLALTFPAKRMLFMHIVVIVALVAMLGGADFFRGLFVGSNPFANVWAGTSKLMMFLTGAIFIYICLKSFQFARRYEDKKIDDCK